jgi:chemotaxis methyl-accepting protein methylase
MTIRQFMEIVKSDLNLNLTVYQASFLHKTLEQRMMETMATGLNGYVDRLIEDPHELRHLQESLQIGFSQFFRNQVDMALLEIFVMPELVQFETEHPSPSLRIWSAGCADGPEPYSLAMMADKVLCDRDLEVPVMVFGTDVSASAIEKASVGVYEPGALQNVRLYYADRYFTRKKNQMVIDKCVKDMVDFSVADLIDPGFSSPPAGIFGDFDLVSCCNLLIYYTQEVQFTILEKLFLALGAKGHLLVGESERMIVEKFGKFRLRYPHGNLFLKY